jgi:hypothetical protein
MSMFWLWIKAVGKHWKRELLGGALIALLGLFSELSGITLAPRIYEASAVIVLFYAMFLAWRDEHTKVEQIERAKKTEENSFGSMLGRYLNDSAARWPMEEHSRALREHSDALRHQSRDREWPRLIEPQKVKLASLLKTLGPHTVWIIRPNNQDFIGLAADFDAVFRSAEWSVPNAEPYSPGEEPLGLTVRSLIPDLQERVASAIVSATGLPAIVGKIPENERKYWNVENLIVCVGPKIMT